MRSARCALGRLGLAAAALVALAALAAAPPSRADGDPASDYLITENIFLPYQSPSPGATAALESAVNAVYADGDRVKVALIYDPQDLGAVPSLFGRPADYAQFLSIEISFWYKGPLLVVMPSGFGIYDGGDSIAAAEQVLQSTPVAAASPDDLAVAATTALDRLEAAGALHSPDLTPPLVTAHPASATQGRRATLRFDVYDDSGSSSAVVRVYEQDTLLATLTSPMGFAIGTRAVSVQWPVPGKLRSRQLRFCVIATDRSGNHSKPACAPFLRVR
jgi:hypothetical protein